MTTRTVLMTGLLMYQTIVCHAQAVQDIENAAAPALSLSLRDALRIALSAQGNYEIEISAEAVNSAEAQAQQARGLAVRALVSLQAPSSQSTRLPSA